MKERHFDTKADEIIRASVNHGEEPCTELNNKLKAAVYEKERIMRRQPETRALSIWYLPMLFNLIVFTMLGIVSIMVISNMYLAYLAAGICFYIAMAGVLLTVVGVKRTNLKKDITIRIGKRGALV